MILGTATPLRQILHEQQEETGEACVEPPSCIECAPGETLENLVKQGKIFSATAPFSVKQGDSR